MAPSTIHSALFDLALDHFNANVLQVSGLAFDRTAATAGAVATSLGRKIVEFVYPSCDPASLLRTNTFLSLSIFTDAYVCDRTLSS